MKRFKHHIKEALDKPYQMRSFTARDGHVYEFETDDGREGRITIEMEDDYSYELDGDVAVVVFEIDGTTVKTGKGDQFRIFATVANAIDDFMRTRRDDVGKIHFSADKPMATAGSRVSLYKKFAQKLAKKYKLKLDTFDAGNVMEFDLIKEEWVTQNDWVGDMFKNPSSRELSEYLKTVNQFNIAGIVADGDIYVFDGMHDDGFEEIRKHKNGYPRKAFRWRAIVQGGKLASLGPSGGDPIDYYGVSKETRETLFKDMAAVYNNKYLKSRMGTYDQAFAEVVRAFMRFSKMEEQEVFAELEQLKKKYKVK